MFNSPQNNTIYKGDEYFQKLLNKLGIDFPVHHLRMYLLGYIISPEDIHPSDPLDEILLRETPDEVQFSSMELADDFYQCYSSLWNSLTNYLSSSNTPKLKKLSSGEKTIKEMIEETDDKGSELVHFLMGADESGASEYFDSHPVLILGSEMLENTVEQLAFFDSLKSPEKLSRTEVEEVYQTTLDLDELWSVTFRDISKKLTAYRLGEEKPMSENEINEVFEQIMNTDPDFK